MIRFCMRKFLHAKIHWKLFVRTTSTNTSLTLILAALNTYVLYDDLSLRQLSGNLTFSVEDGY